ncbi:hypothetical protein E2320_003082 [Naja naja]|nr:hypothetical protein E2320_003082 [Naja naja]
MVSVFPTWSSSPPSQFSFLKVVKQRQLCQLYKKVSSKLANARSPPELQDDCGKETGNCTEQRRQVTII